MIGFGGLKMMMIEMQIYIKKVFILLFFFIHSGESVEAKSTNTIAHDVNLKGLTKKNSIKLTKFQKITLSFLAAAIICRGAYEVLHSEDAFDSSCPLLHKIVIIPLAGTYYLATDIQFLIEDFFNWYKIKYNVGLPKPLRNSPLENILRFFNDLKEFSKRFKFKISFN